MSRNLKEFFTESKRVLRVTKKPTKEEYKGVAMVSAFGILIMGAIGFVLIMLETLTSIVIVTVIVIIIIAILLMLKQQ